jgi:hypothetical protein
MPSFRVPITRRVIDPDPAGPIRTVLQARLGMDVLAGAGVWIWAPTCVIDTGSSYTLVSADVFSEDYSPTAPPLLGLNDFIDLFRVTFDGRYSLDAPFGHVLLETD